MGQSTDAILAFGVDLGESGSFPWDDSGDDFETWWAAQNGVSEPEEEYSESTKGLHQEYWERKRKLEKQCPVELITHCHSDSPMYVLALRGTKTEANRGYPEPLPYIITTPNPEGLVKFAQKYNIKLDKAPQWLLFSYWG